MNAIIEAIDVEIASHNALIGRLEQARDLLADEAVPEPLAKQQEVPKVTSETKPGRGRPSSQASKGRKAAVLGALTTKPRTVAQILAAADTDEELSSKFVDYALRRLESKGQVERAGKLGAAIVWRKVEEVKKPPASITTNGNRAQAKPVVKPNGYQEPQLEGRIFGLICHRALTAGELADELDADIEAVQGVVSKLLREGDAEMLKGKVLGRA